MNIGTIAPIKLLKKYCTITKIQYVVSELYQKEPEYASFYRSQKKKGDTVILDIRNLKWRRSPDTLTNIPLCIKELNPDYIILPSFMFEIKRTMDYLNTLKLDIDEDKLVGCLEGTCLEDFNELKTYYEDKIGISKFAIPAHIYNVCKEVDSELTIYLDNRNRTEELEGKQGILVTSLPVRLGLQGRLLSDCLPSPPNLTFYEEEDKYPKIVERNIKELIRLME